MEKDQQKIKKASSKQEMTKKRKYSPKEHWPRSQANYGDVKRK